MRKILYLTLFFMASIGLHAQSETDSNSGRARLGVKAEWNLNSPATNFNDFISVYGNGSGFNVGAFYNIPILQNLYFEPGLGLFYNTIIIAPDELQARLIDYKLPPEGSLRNLGFRIPFNFGYKFSFTPNISMSVFTGPEINVGLMLKRYDNATRTSHSLYGDGWHRVDAQWLFGVRFYYADNWTFHVSGGIGMSNLVGGNQYKGDHFRRNTFSIGVGYIF